MADARARRLHWLIRGVILAAAVTLGFGLVLPSMTVTTHFGEYDVWVRLLKPDLNRESTYSILSGILTMLGGRSTGIGLLLLFFSVIFPTAKLAIMAMATEELSRGRRAHWLLAVAHHTGKFSMLDVMVLALIVIAIKGMGKTTTVDLRLGVFFFAASVIGSLAASVMLHRLETRGAHEQPPAQAGG